MFTDSSAASPLDPLQQYLNSASVNRGHSENPNTMDLTSRLFDAVQENSQSDILDHRQSDVPAEDDWIKASRESDWAAAQNASFESPTPVSQDSRLMRDLQQMLTEWQGLRDRGGIEFVETRLDAIENFLSELSQSNGTGGTVVSHSPDFHASSTPSSVRSTLLEEVSPIERQKPPIPERTLQIGRAHV